MKILAVPNSFKGSRSSLELCKDLKEGFFALDDSIDFVAIPVADGGDGFLVSLVEALEGKYIITNTVDALNRKITTKTGIAKGYGIVEMALASGLAMLNEDELNPLQASSYGTGILIDNFLRQGITKIILGIGGSATNDAGMGALAALGFKFLDSLGKELFPCGQSLEKVAQINTDNVYPYIHDADITIVCDVTNPLLGTKGASFVYAPQKGASKEIVKRLDEGMRNFARVVSSFTGKDYSEVEGSGAAGGIGYGLMSFLKGVSLKSGVDTVLDICNYDEHLEGADLVITGEGRLDEQTKQNKLPMGVGLRAKAKNIPCVAICGYSTLPTHQFLEIGIKRVYSFCDLVQDIDYCIKNAGKLTKKLTKVIYRDFIENNNN